MIQEFFSELFEALLPWVILLFSAGLLFFILYVAFVLGQEYDNW